MDIGSNLKTIREIKNLTQEYIATELGLSIRAYSKIETGESKLTIDRLIKICEIIEVPFIKILQFDSKQLFSDQKENNHQVSNQHINSLYEIIIEEKDKRITLLEKHIAMIKNDK